MIVTFDREPFGWVHPFYRRRQVHPLMNWGNFVQPALETVDTLNQLLRLAEHECSQSSQQQQQPSDKFEVKMDVQQFSPNEIDVKMVDNCVIIEGKHEEKQDEQGYISRHFVRRYRLPDDVKPETVTCNLSSDGILCVTAPRMLEEKKTTERNVPINFTGKPAITTKDATKKESKADDKHAEADEKMEVLNSA